MPADQTRIDETVTPFDAIRFCFFITAAMWTIQIRDSIAMWGHTSTQVPSQSGLPIPCVVMSGRRRLEARLSVPIGNAKASILILHGIGERLDYWREAQQLLAGNSIASLVVHYSGYGKSGGAIMPANLLQDAISVYAELQRLLPGLPPPFVLGLSMGTGIAINAMPFFKPIPSGVILCEPFSSLRDAAVEVCRSLPVVRSFARQLATLLPDVYRTASSLEAASTSGSAQPPLLIVHSDADELFPVAMARKIFAAASHNSQGQAELAITHGYAHNDAYLRPEAEYWQPILSFIRRRAGAHESGPREFQKL